MAVLFAVGGEADPSVEEHFEVGPYVFKMCLAGLFEDALDDNEHPRGNAGEVRDVGMEGLLCDFLYLGLPVVHESHFLFRDADKVDQRVDVLYEDGGEVANKGMGLVEIGAVASAEDKALAGKETALWIVVEVEDHAISAASVMDVVEGFTADGDEFAFVVSSA